MVIGTSVPDSGSASTIPAARNHQCDFEAEGEWKIQGRKFQRTSMPNMGFSGRRGEIARDGVRLADASFQRSTMIDRGWVWPRRKRHGNGEEQWRPISTASKSILHSRAIGNVGQSGAPVTWRVRERF